MTNVTKTEVRRGKGRPASFPGQDTKQMGWNLPVTTLELLASKAKQKEVTQNELLDKAVRAYLRERKGS